MSAAVLLLALAIPIAGVAQTCGACGTLDFADTPVRAAITETADGYVTPALTGLGNFRATISASSATALPAALPAGTYPAWCGTSYEDGVIVDGVYTATATPTMGPVVWNRINYLLNHKMGSVGDVQAAIWTLLGALPAEFLTTEGRANAAAMVADAVANGSGFVPRATDRVGIVLRSYTAGYQHIIVEAPNCPAVAGRVWRDANRNGMPDAGEEGLNGVSVALLNDAGSVLATVVSAPSPADYPWLSAGTNGWYRFDGVCGGTYRVRVATDQPALGGALPTTPADRPVTLAARGMQNVSFGFDGGAPPLQLTCPQAWAQSGVDYLSRVSITGGLPPEAVSYTGMLPPGLRMDSAGTVSGQLQAGAAAGPYPFTVLVSRSGGAAGAACSISVPPGLALQCPQGRAQASRPYSGSFVPSGGNGAYTMAITTPAALPPGLSLDPVSGRLAGTPTATGSFVFNAVVEDRLGIASTAAVATCSLTVADPPPPLTVQCPIRTGMRGVVYASSLAAAGGAGGYRFSIVGTLPPGLALDSGTGRISGTPTEVGSFSFTIQVEDAAGATATLNCGITVEHAFTLMCPTNAGYVGVAYRSAAGLSGGTGPFRFTASSLPAGLTVDAATGAIGGTPLTANVYNVVISASDAATGASESATCRLQVYAAPKLTCPVAAGQPGVPYSSRLSATGGFGSYTFSIPSGALPSGWALDATGLLTAATPVAGVVSFTAGVTDNAGAATATATTACSIRIVAPLAISCPAKTAQVGFAYSSVLMATGGTGPFKFAITGSLPSGLSLNATTGAITGTPTKAGSYSFTATVTDAEGKVATLSCAITVAAAPNSCGLSWGYWKNHTSAWPAKTLELGGRSYSFSELTALLAMPVRGDESIELAHQLIAAKLNVLNGTNPATAKGAIEKADRLLAQYPGKLPHRVEPSCSDGDQMEQVAEALERFNNDGAAQPGCVVKK